MISTGRLAILALFGSLLCASAGAIADGPDAKELVKRSQTDPALRETLLREARSAGSFCANCHGEAGFSRFPEVPNLASQHPAYILNQIEAFLSGRRKNEFMEGLMKVLSERDKAAIALAFSSAPAIPASVKPGPRAKEGGEHFQRLCARCHQADARGAETFPRLAGQQQEYLRVTLRRYLAMSGERNYPPMSGAVMQLGERNIDAVVDYLSNAQ